MPGTLGREIPPHFYVVLGKLSRNLTQIETEELVVCELLVSGTFHVMYSSASASRLLSSRSEVGCNSVMSRSMGEEEMQGCLSSVLDSLC